MILVGKLFIRKAEVEQAGGGESKSLRLFALRGRRPRLRKSAKLINQRIFNKIRLSGESRKFKFLLENGVFSAV